jgi:hypothetical protein
MPVELSSGRNASLRRVFYTLANRQPGVVVLDSRQTILIWRSPEILRPEL